MYRFLPASLCLPGVTGPDPSRQDRADERLMMLPGQPLRQTILSRGIKLNDPLALRFDSGGAGDCGGVDGGGGADGGLTRVQPDGSLGSATYCGVTHCMQM